MRQERTASERRTKVRLRIEGSLGLGKGGTGGAWVVEHTVARPLELLGRRLGGVVQLIEVVVRRVAPLLHRHASHVTCQYTPQAARSSSSARTNTPLRHTTCMRRSYAPIATTTALASRDVYARQPRLGGFEATKQPRPPESLHISWQACARVAGGGVPSSG